MQIVVDSASGRLSWPGGSAACALGKGGVIAEADKREGDGATPLGVWPLRRVFARRDRVPQLVTALPFAWLDPADGWCDDAADAAYNRLIRHPCAASAEHLWREDGLYDVIVVLGHNDDPVRPGAGSAIFLHCCKWDEGGAMKSTLGCIAVPRDVLVDLVAAAQPGSTLTII